MGASEVSSRGGLVGGGGSLDVWGSLAATASGQLFESRHFRRCGAAGRNVPVVFVVFVFFIVLSHVPGSIQYIHQPRHRKRCLLWHERNSESSEDSHEILSRLQSSLTKASLSGLRLSSHELGLSPHHQGLIYYRFTLGSLRAYFRAEYRTYSKVNVGDRAAL